VTWNLRKISETEILRAKLAVQEQNLRVRGYYDERVAALRVKVEEAQKNLQRLKNSYAQMKAGLQKDRDALIDDVRADLERARREFHVALQQWRRAYAMVAI
jgi:hypothetical protein